MASFSTPALTVIGAGFLGRAVAEEAQRGGWRVHPVVRSEASAKQLQPKFPHVRADDAIAEGFWAKRVPSCEAMVWAMAPNRERPQDDFLLMHHQGAVRAAEWARRKGVRFVYISSTSVYAEDGGEWVDEDAPLAHDDPRAMAMVEAEKACLRSGGTVLRCAGLYGRERILRPDPEGPERWLNLVHVEDAARAVGWGLRQRGQVYNVCENEPRRRGKPGGAWPEKLRRARRNKKVRNARLRSLGWVCLKREESQP
jgi:nucleoside-diphosphate-sugar epimerase